MDVLVYPRISEYIHIGNVSQLTVAAADNSPVEKITSSRANNRAPRFLLLMPQDLRYEIERIAIENGRTLTAEINMRLRGSLQSTTPTVAPGASLAHVMEQPATYLADRPSKTGDLELSAVDQSLLKIFHRLTKEKQAALIDLLR